MSHSDIWSSNKTYPERIKIERRTEQKVEKTFFLKYVSVHVLPPVGDVLKQATCYTITGFIRGILRGVRYAKSLRVLFLHRRSPSWTTPVLYSRVVFIFNEPTICQLISGNSTTSNSSKQWWPIRQVLRPFISEQPSIFYTCLCIHASWLNVLVQ